MDNIRITPPYESPEVKAVETQMRKAILAASTPNSTDPYARDTWDE